MMEHGELAFTPEEAAVLGERARDLAERAEALSRFAQESPELAQQAGVEVSALEAHAIRRSGVLERIAAGALGAARARRSVAIGGADYEALSRLEGVLAVSNARLGSSLRAMDQQSARGGMDAIGSMIGLATGAIGLWKALF